MQINNTENYQQPKTPLIFFHIGSSWINFFIFMIIIMLPIKFCFLILTWHLNKTAVHKKLNLIKQNLTLTQPDEKEYNQLNKFVTIFYRLKEFSYFVFIAEIMFQILSIIYLFKWKKNTENTMEINQDILTKIKKSLSYITPSNLVNNLDKELFFQVINRVLQNINNECTNIVSVKNNKFSVNTLINQGPFIFTVNGDNGLLDKIYLVNSTTSLAELNSNEIPKRFSLSNQENVYVQSFQNMTLSIHNNNSYVLFTSFANDSFYSSLISKENQSILLSIIIDKKKNITIFDYKNQMIIKNKNTYHIFNKVVFANNILKARTNSEIEIFIYNISIVFHNSMAYINE